MAHLRACEVPQLLHKFVVIVGDSVYKDLVLPLQKDCLPSSSQLKAKGELSFEHHTRLEGCQWEGLHHCTRYARCARSALVTAWCCSTSSRACSRYVEDILEQMQRDE